MTRILMAVCTRKRPMMLKSCLSTLIQQYFPKNIESSILVIDNDPPGACDTLMVMKRRSFIPIDYIPEPRRGIAIARNRAIEHAIRIEADWIAFTDDDCIADEYWAIELLKAAHKYEADMVRGRRIFSCREGGWSREDANFPDGTFVKMALTHNVLISKKIFYQLRFDETLTHGEDAEFSEDARSIGAKIVFATNAVVFETVPLSRSTLTYQMKLAFRHGADHTYRHKRRHGFFFAYVRWASQLFYKLPISIGKILFSFFAFPFQPERAAKRIFRYSRRVMGFFGSCAGLCGYMGDPYKNTDGC